MYEEEEDDLPRHYRYLTSHLQTNSPDMNNRVNAYITTQTAMATMARYNEVNRLFSESFPTAVAYNNSMYMSPLVNNNGGYPHRLSTSGSSQGTPATRTQSVSSHVSSQSQYDRRDSTSVGSPALHPGTAMSSPPALTPGSSTTDADTSESKSTPYQTPSAFSNLPLDPQLLQQSTTSSAFTSELSNDVKMLANIDMGDPMAMHFMGEDPSSFQMFGPYPGDSSTLEDSSKESAHHTIETFSPQDGTIPDDNFLSLDSSMGLLDIPTNSFSRLGTPGGGAQGDWENFVDFGSDQ